jgi:hypothetical protein
MVAFQLHLHDAIDLARILLKRLTAPAAQSAIAAQPEKSRVEPESGTLAA